MKAEGKFDDIRPFRDSEVQNVLQRMTKEPGLVYMLKKIKTEEEINKEFQALSSVFTIKDFQEKHIAPYANLLIHMTIDELTISGIEKINPHKRYLFLGNHRDIILDSALLNSLFTKEGIPTTEIGLGDNLLVFGWIKDLVKLNRGFIVKRSLQGREMLQASMLLSEYIYRNITENEHSIWLAQRPGRTKDGNDQTHPGLIKMLMLHKRKTPVEAINALNICPVCISYENEPCGDSKILTAYHSEMNIPYKKTPEEDLKSMGRGLLYHKGRVHIHISSPLHIDPNQYNTDMNENDFMELAAREIDKKIYAGYRFFPKNYIAFDILKNSDKFLKEGKYTPEEKYHFMEEALETAKKTEKDEQVIKHIYTKMYAYPLINGLNTRD